MRIDVRARVVARVRRSALAAAFVRWCVRSCHRGGDGAGRASRVLSLALRGTPTDPATRARTVDALVDLCFDLVRSAGVERFVEAGAKDAAASRRAARSVDSVVAFEANPHTYRRFADGLAAGPVDYLPLALSDEAGPVEFHVRQSDTGSPRSDGQGSLLRRSSYGPGFQRVTVDAARLDDHFASSPGLRTALWVDVEGATAPVLRGARSLLDVTDVAMVEVEERRVWDGQEWLARDVIGYLREHGLAPIARDCQSRFQHNIVFVRRGLLVRPEVTEAIDRWREAVTRRAPPTGSPRDEATDRSFDEHMS